MYHIAPLSQMHTVLRILWRLEKFLAHKTPFPWILHMPEKMFSKINFVKTNGHEFYNVHNVWAFHAIVWWAHWAKEAGNGSRLLSEHRRWLQCNIIIYFFSFSPLRNLRKNRMKTKMAHAKSSWKVMVSFPVWGETYSLVLVCLHSIKYVWL